MAKSSIITIEPEIEPETETVVGAEAVAVVGMQAAAETNAAKNIEAAPELLYKQAALVAQLQRHEITAAKCEHQLEYYTLDQAGKLQRIDANVIFVRTGEKGGFAILPAWREDACTLYSFPHAEKNAEHGSSFGTRHRCGNVFDVLVEVAQCYFAKVDGEEEEEEA
jgi:hypothetical protein